MLVQSMGTNAVYQNVISSNCEIGDLRGAWNAIWDKYDSKKPAMQSQLATEFSNCLHMPDETVEQFINRLNDICARMVNDPGEAMKKTQVIKGICNEFAAFVQIEARRDMRGRNTAPALSNAVRRHFAVSRQEEANNC